MSELEDLKLQILQAASEKELLLIAIVALVGVIGLLTSGIVFLYLKGEKKDKEMTKMQERNFEEIKRIVERYERNTDKFTASLDANSSVMDKLIDKL